MKKAGYDFWGLISAIDEARWRLLIACPVRRNPYSDLIARRLEQHETGSGFPVGLPLASAVERINTLLFRLIHLTTELTDACHQARVFPR